MRLLHEIRVPVHVPRGRGLGETVVVPSCRPPGAKRSDGGIVTQAEYDACRTGVTTTKPTSCAVPGGWIMDPLSKVWGQCGPDGTIDWTTAPRPLDYNWNQTPASPPGSTDTSQPPATAGMPTAQCNPSIQGSCPTVPTGNAEYDAAVARATYKPVTMFESFDWTWAAVGLGALAVVGGVWYVAKRK